MTVWVTSDSHFGHHNIIAHASRPFNSFEEMDAALIERWNARVAPSDEVYHLGDFLWHAETQRTIELVKSLNGRKIMLRGNHDPKSWGGGTPYREIRFNGRKIVLCHYPIEDWNGRAKGSLHLHGHTHNHDPWSGRNRINVCVEAWDYAPVSLEEIISREW